MEAVMRGLCAVVILMVASFTASADDPTMGSTVMVYGKADGPSPGWGIVTNEPAGWTQDCCRYAKAIGVNLVLYQGDWSGDPDRVMVLNVWPSKKPTLADEVKADRGEYLHRDSKAKVAGFPVQNKSMSCQGTYYQGTDRMDDAVVFCDPAKQSGIRLSWSVTIAESDPARQQTLLLFRKVVERSLYMRVDESPAPSAKKAKL